MLLRDFERGKAFARRMGAAEEGERLVVEALQAEREAIDPGGAKVGEAGGLDRIGIGFERDLDVARRAPNGAIAASITASTVAGSISDGVPPPKKIEVSFRPGSSRASCARSASSASRHSSWSMLARTWLLKSQ